MFAFAFELEKDLLPVLEKRIIEISKLPLDVGYFASQGVHEESGLTYANLAAIQHKGIAGKMVARRFFDIGLAFKPVKSTPFLKDLNKYLSHLEGKPKISAMGVMANLGGEYVEVFRNIMGSSMLPDNKPSTIAQKGGRNTPLVDTGDLKANMSYRINGVVVTP